MTMNDSVKNTSISLGQLTSFLEHQPDVFQQHPHLLELVVLADDRGAASLLERQIGVLKQRLQEQQNKQNEFIQVARENEAISDNFSELICKLIGFTNLSEFAAELPNALRSSFSIDEVSFKTEQSAQRSDQDQVNYENALRRLQNNCSVCDNRLPTAIMNLFFSDEVKSAALVPMNTISSSAPLGIIALGSYDSQRYTNDLGTAHLDRLGTMAGTCLARLQPNVEQ